MKNGINRLILTMLMAVVLCGCRVNTTQQTQTVKESCWSVTQHGQNEGNQSSFYSITNDNNELILIDGGYDYDSQRVREIIEMHGNRVAAWIISHPHPDHVGAFNSIMENPGEIVVDQIYTIEVNEERYYETAEEYDQISVYEKFRDLTKDWTNVTYVRENDEWDVSGLHFKALHVWNEETDELDSNLCNKGSMVFVMSGNKEKMLFCSDLESDAQDPVLERHKEELNVDYVQLGHHGNWGPSIEFYEGISPKAVFFDAPDWLVNMRENIYDAYELKDYFQEKNVTIYSFGTAPNTIAFH